MAYRKSYKRMMRSERNRFLEPYSKIFYIIIMTVVPVLLSTTVYNVSSLVDQILFKSIANYQGYSKADISSWWGIFVGKYKVLINVPIALASALAASSVPSITRAHTARNKPLVVTKIQSAMRFTMIVTIPCAVGLFVLASPILQLLFKDPRPIGALMIRAGAISVIFYAISTLSNAMLQGIDHMGEPVKNAITALVIHMLFLILFMFAFKMDIFAVIYSTVIYAFLMCILNSRSLHRYLKYHHNVRKTFIIPMIASIIMGAVTYGTYKVTMMLSNLNFLCTVFSIIVAVVVYTLLILLMKGITKEEMAGFPGGSRLSKIFEKVGLL